MRMIDADALKETLKDLCSASNNVMQRQIENSILHGIVPQVIDDEPTIDAVPIKHGRWVVKNGYGEYGWCSECGNRSWTQWDGVMPIPLLTPFCPNCGARMDGDVNDEQAKDDRN